MPVAHSPTLTSRNSGAPLRSTQFHKAADLFRLDVDLIFYDTTTAYFEIDEPDEESILVRQCSTVSGAFPDEATRAVALIVA